MKHLIYDIFVKNDYIYVISTFKNSCEKPLKITVNETPLKEYFFKDAAPMLYYSAKLTNTDSTNFVITINSQVFTWINPHTKLGVEYIKPKLTRNKLAFATLFKDDYPFLSQMINHYRNQGVDCFYLYYNGSKLPNNLPQGPDINYYLWDIQPYFWTSRKHGFHNRKLHNAQTSFLTMVQHKYFDDNEWIILADLDELIINTKPQEKTILDRLQQSEAEVISIRNHWAKIDNLGKIYYVAEDLGPFIRTKCIYRGSYTGWIGVHHPFGTVNKVDMTDLRLLHVVNVLHNDRLKYIVEPLLTYTFETGSTIIPPCIQPTRNNKDSCRNPIQPKRKYHRTLSIFKALLRPKITCNRTCAPPPLRRSRNHTAFRRHPIRPRLTTCAPPPLRRIRNNTASRRQPIRPKLTFKFKRTCAPNPLEIVPLLASK